jgi:hypothetical protein
VNYTRAVPVFRIAPALALALVAACGLPRSPDSIDSRCAMGFDMLESDACRPGVNPEYLKFQLEEYKKQCTDAGSVARIEKIKATCLTGLKAAVRERKDDRRQIRAKYVGQVSALLLDPAYAPAADRYRDSEDPFALEQLLGLARKYGIDSTYAKELDLW